MSRLYLCAVVLTGVISACANSGVARLEGTEASANAALFNGVWRDTETDDLHTIEIRKGIPTVVSVVDQNDGEVSKIVASTWRQGVLSWSFEVPSTGYLVQFQTNTVSEKLMQTSWKSGPKTAPPTSSGEQDLLRETAESSQAEK
jgi:hypothetical protein